MLEMNELELDAYFTGTRNPVLDPASEQLLSPNIDLPMVTNCNGNILLIRESCLRHGLNDY